MLEIIEEIDSRYRFCLKTPEGNPLLHSVIFAGREEINNTLAGLIPLLEHQTLFERKTDHSGKFLFVLKDLAGKTIGTSQLYNSEAGMENGIKNLKSSLVALKDHFQRS